MKTTVCEYSDGSGNRYIVTIDTIEYKPITKENSSTGNYSGGLPVKKEIAENDFHKIKYYMNEIFDNTSIHIKDRIKGSGRVALTEDTENTRVVNIRQSDDKDHLEGLLKDLIN